jgi:hypothetical protein
MLLAKEFASTKRTLAKKSQALLAERQLNHQLQRRIRELEREIERGPTLIERDPHNSSMPPSFDPPWKKVLRTRSLRQKTGLKAGICPSRYFDVLSIVRSESITDGTLSPAQPTRPLA